MGSASSSVGLSAWRWAFASPRFGSRWFRSGQRKAIIRTHRRLGTGSDYIGLVRLKGLEPTRIAAREPKSRMSTNSITGAYSISLCSPPGAQDSGLQVLHVCQFLHSPHRASAGTVMRCYSTICPQKSQLRRHIERGIMNETPLFRWRNAYESYAESRSRP